MRWQSYLWGNTAFLFVMVLAAIASPDWHPLVLAIVAGIVGAVAYFIVVMITESVYDRRHH